MDLNRMTLGKLVKLAQEDADVARDLRNFFTKIYLEHIRLKPIVQRPDEPTNLEEQLRLSIERLKDKP